jgi:hypothetical protein
MQLFGRNRLGLVVRRKGKSLILTYLLGHQQYKADLEVGEFQKHTKMFGVR